MAFDLGAANDVDIVLDIAVATTTVDGGTAVAAGGFTTVCAACRPTGSAGPRGNAAAGDFELEFTLGGGALGAGGAWSHPGGGLAVRFRAAGGFAADLACAAGLLMGWTAADPSGHFVARFHSDGDGAAPFSNLEVGSSLFAVLGSKKGPFCRPLL